MIRSIRCGKGFGDSIYLQGVVRILVEQQGFKFQVCSDYADIFEPIRSKIDLQPFRRKSVDMVAHYIPRKSDPKSDQFNDCCKAACIRHRQEIRLDWKPMNPDIVRMVQSSGRPVACVALPRQPMDRTDGYGLELLPDCDKIQAAINAARKAGAFIVQIGRGAALRELGGIDLDLANQTRVGEAIDAVWASDMVIGYCSFMVPLAESLDKPGIYLWSQRGLDSEDTFIRLITPTKIFNKPALSSSALDISTDAEISGVVNDVLRKTQSLALV